MTAQAVAHNPGAMPDHIPVFPLAGVLLLPRGNLPLNIFEPRYLAMVDDALRAERLIGMIQPRKGGEACPSAPSPLYGTGCAGRITSFSETGDGRYLLTLTGICRFHVAEEVAPVNGYRRVRAAWDAFADDFTPRERLDIDRVLLKQLLKHYFASHELSCDWDTIDSAPDEKLITCLSMICPFEPGEKQALLEAACSGARAERFMAMLRMAVESGRCGGAGGCH